MYIDEPLKKYIDELAARQPMPGGGSAASLTGALGIALLEMACNFTIGNKRYKDVEEVMSAYIGPLKKIREEFMTLIDEDIKIYGGMCSAFKTKDEKIIDKALKDGYYISLKMCKLSKSGMDIAMGLAAKSNLNLITDVGCGAELLKASFDSGVLNSIINLKGVKDASFAETEKSTLNTMKDDMLGFYKKAVANVSERMA